MGDDWVEIELPTNLEKGIEAWQAYEGESIPTFSASGHLERSSCVSR